MQRRNKLDSLNQLGSVKKIEALKEVLGAALFLSILAALTPVSLGLLASPAQAQSPSRSKDASPSASKASSASQWSPSQAHLPSQPQSIFVNPISNLDADTIHVQRGFKLLKRDEAEAAAREFDACSSMSNLTEVALVAVCNNYQSLGNSNKSLSLLDASLRRPRKKNETASSLSGLAALYCCRGGCYHHRHQLPEAEADYVKAARVDPNVVQAQTYWRLAADTCREEKKYEQSLVFLAKATPSTVDPFWLNQRGECFRDMGRYEDAIKDLSDALKFIIEFRKTEPNGYTFLMRDSYIARAKCYDQLGKKQLAAADRKALDNFSQGWATDIFGAAPPAERKAKDPPKTSK